jgi:hypothetical protein
MPASRKQVVAEIAQAMGVPEAARQPSKPNYNALDGDDEPLWGTPAIATAIGKSVQATYYLLRCGDIPAAKIGGQWCTTRRRLKNHFNGLSAISHA